jgi:hypothetical protein
MEMCIKMLLCLMIMIDDKLDIRLSFHAMGSSVVEPRLPRHEIRDVWQMSDLVARSGCLQSFKPRQACLSIFWCFGRKKVIHTRRSSSRFFRHPTIPSTYRLYHSNPKMGLTDDFDEDDRP